MLRCVLEGFLQSPGNRPSLLLGAGSIVAPVPRRTAGEFCPQDGVLERRGNSQKELERPKESGGQGRKSNLGGFLAEVIGTGL